MQLGGEIPGGFRVGFAAEHADRHLDARELGARELDRVDARNEVQRRVRDQIGVQEIADFRGVASGRVLVVVGDQSAQRRRVALLRGGLGGGNERADLVFGRVRGTAARDRKYKRAGEDRVTQARRPTAAGRP